MYVSSYNLREALPKSSKRRIFLVNHLMLMSLPFTSKETMNINLVHPGSLERISAGRIK